MTANIYRKTKTEAPEPTYTNLDKLYWKKEKITKGELIDYYLSVSDFLLPYLKGRAQSLHRFPNGIEESGFYHKDAGDTAPSWVDTVSIYSESTDKSVEYIVCNNRETLGYLINLGCIELNPWNNTIDFPDKPDYLIIDLDPHGVDIGVVVRVPAPPREDLRESVTVREHAGSGVPLSRQLLPHPLVGILGRPHPRGLRVVGARDDVGVDPVHVLHGQTYALGRQLVALLRGRRGQEMTLLERGADVLVVLSHGACTSLSVVAERPGLPAEGQRTEPPDM